MIRKSRNLCIAGLLVSKYQSKNVFGVLQGLLNSRLITKVHASRKITKKVSVSGIAATFMIDHNHHR